MDRNERFILYTRDWCGYCSLVKQAAAQLGIVLEERNIWENPQWESELLSARGRPTVPVLRRMTLDSGRYQRDHFWTDHASEGAIVAG